MIRKKIAIIFTVLGILTFFSSATVFASGIYKAYSKNNFFSAKASDNILLSDSDETRQETISKTFITEDIDNELQKVGYMKIYNSTKYSQDIIIHFKGDDTIGDYYYIEIYKKSLSNSSVSSSKEKPIYSGKLPAIEENVFDSIEAGIEETYEFYVKLETAITANDSNKDLEFSFEVQGYPTSK